MSRILVLSGSPRKNGNTGRLVQSFLKGAEINNQVEVVSVTDYLVNPCTGCNSCYIDEDHKCCQHDDMTLIYDKLSRADIVIVASPVYLFELSAQIKAVLDRLHAPLRKKFPVKKLGLIIVGAAEREDLFDAILVHYRLVLGYFKLQDAGKVLVQGAKQIGEVSEADLKRAYDFGRSFE